MVIVRKLWYSEILVYTMFISDSPYGKKQKIPDS